MNISGIFRSTYSNNTISIKEAQSVDTVSSATKMKNIHKPDVISSATKSKGGDHYFEARA